MNRALLIFLVCTRLFGQSTVTIKTPVALDKLPSGDLFALTQKAGVQRFRETTNGLTPVGSFALSPWQFPIDIVSAIVNKQPALFIAMFAQGRGNVSQYTLDGKLVFSWSGQHVVGGLDFDPLSDTIYVASSDSAEIYAALTNSRKDVLQYCGSIVGARHLGPVVVDESRDQLLVGEVQDGEIYTFNLRTHKSHLFATGLGSPQALLLSSNSQQLFIADAARRKVYRLDLSKPNATPSVFSAAPVYKEPVGLARLASGDIVVADDRADALFIVSATGVFPRTKQ